MKHEKLIFLLCMGISLAVDFYANAIENPSKQWTVEIGGEFAETPVAYPSKGTNSLVFGTGGQVTRVSGKGDVLFRVKLGPEAGRGGSYWPSVADVDGDGKEEIITGRNDGYVYALDAENGKVMWESRIPDHSTGYEWATAADIDDDGRAEVVVTTSFGWVYMLDHDGAFRWRAKLEAYRPSAPTIADVDSDGEPEIVYGTATRHLVALDANGNLEWASFQPPHHLGRTFPLVADLDRDNRAEVYGMSSMISPDKGLVCLNGADGSLRWNGLTIGKAYSGRAPTRFADGNMGVLSCDKGGNIHAHEADGSLRWHTRLSGRGVYNPPVTADVDGNGSLDIVATVRDQSTDGNGNNWYVVAAETGEILGAWNHPDNGIMGPAALDLDEDGVIEVVNCSKEGIVTAYTFGSGSKSQSVVFGSARQRTFPVRVSRTIACKEKAASSIRLIDKIEPIRFGRNSLSLELPGNFGETMAVELDLTHPNGSRSIEVFRAENGNLTLTWNALSSGKYLASLRLIDLNSGKTHGVQKLESSLDRADEKLRERAKAVVNKIKSMIAGQEATRLVLGMRAHYIEARAEALADEIQRTEGEPYSHRATLGERVDQFITYLAQSDNFAALVSAEVEAGRNPKFICWNDANPWDNMNPLDDLPLQGSPLTVAAWAFGNEKESVCINVLNVSHDPLTLRVEPGRVTGGDSPLKATEVASLHRVLWLPTKEGNDIPDLLPKLDDGRLIDLSPGEVRQIWINLSTRELDPGRYVFTWPIRSLDADATTMDVSVRLDVSSARIPEKSRFYTGFWSAISFGEFSTIPDLNDHLQTFWDRAPSFPLARANAEGQLIGELDWSQWDTFLDSIKQHGVIRLHHIPIPEFPEGFEPSVELKIKAQRYFVETWMAHMAKFGLGYQDFAFYIEDETGLRGTHEHFMKGARHIKEIDPKLQVYANPWGAITKDMLREMAPLTDVWQPGMEIIEYHGPEIVEIMRANGNRRIAMYTPPGGARSLLPLGFYRSQPWLALEWAIEGGGWWVYSQADLFGTGPLGDPDYGAVNWDGRELVWSRRWEAARDGVEDYNAVCMLRDLAETKSDQAAKTVIEEAIAYVASKCITGMPREAADYDMEFNTLTKHRNAIRNALERLQQHGARTESQ